MALDGVITLSTYPLFSWARDWTAWPLNDEHSHRVFPENSTEGTYIASRLLLQSLARSSCRMPALSCDFRDKGLPDKDKEVFAPALLCQADPSKPYAPLPDYAPPYWTESEACKSDSPGLRCKPAVWLSVITRNGTWPLATLNDRTLDHGDRDGQAQKTNSAGDRRWPGTPRSTKTGTYL